jgi:Flp pilus assembly protein TadG
MRLLKKEIIGNESGAVAVYVAIGLLVLLGFGALAMDIAHIVSVKRELTKAAEAGALAGGRALWPLALPVDTTGNVAPDCAQGVNVARTTATKNRVEGTNLTTGEVTAEAGKWNYTTKTFTPEISAAANSVRVTASRANVQTILAQVLGQAPRNMSATAVAIMDYAQGIGCLPITLDDNAAFDEDGNVKMVDVTCRMTPDPGDNAGWFTIPPASASASQLKIDVNNLYTDNLRSLNKDDWINLQNGADASVLAAVQDEFNKFMDADGTWTVVIPTVNTLKFGQDEQVVRFVGLKITEVVNTTSDKKVFGHLVKLCEVPKGLPGGPKSGVLAPPKLVQ